MYQPELLDRPAARGHVTRMGAAPDRTAFVSMRDYQAGAFLRSQPWFRELTLAEQHLALREATIERVRNGTELAAGQHPEGWHAVLSGSLRLQRRSCGEQVATMQALGPGDWFDEDALVAGSRRLQGVVAHRDSELLCIPAAAFQALMRTSLVFQAAVARRLAGRLQQALALVEVHRTGTAEQRLALQLSRAFDAARRHRSLTQEELGCLAGIGRQTVNRTLGAFAQRGLVSLRCGRIIGIDHDAIDRFLGGDAFAPAPLP